MFARLRINLNLEKDEMKFYLEFKMLAFLNVTQVTTKHIKNSVFPNLKQLNSIQLFADANLNVSARCFFSQTQFN